MHSQHPSLALSPRPSLTLPSPSNPGLAPCLALSPRRVTLPELQAPMAPMMVSPRRLEHINCVVERSEGEGGLYIGDTIATLKQEYIESNQIEAVLCCNLEASTNLQTWTCRGSKPEFKFINIQDHQLYPINLHFQQAYDYIQRHRSNNHNVLIQCHGGVSRSGTILISYLMRRNSWSLQRTHKFVTQKRPRIKPNAGFWKQLQDYQRELFYKHNEPLLNKQLEMLSNDANEEHEATSSNNPFMTPKVKRKIFDTAQESQEALNSTNPQTNLVFSLQPDRNAHRLTTNQNFNPELPTNSSHLSPRVLAKTSQFVYESPRPAKSPVVLTESSNVNRRAQNGHEIRFTVSPCKISVNAGRPGHEGEDRRNIKMMYSNIFESFDGSRQMRLSAGLAGYKKVPMNQF